MRVEYWVRGPMYINGPGNDTLARVRPLKATDVRCIVKKHWLVLASAFDECAKYELFRNDPPKGAAKVLRFFEEVQRDIVWRGTWLERVNVDQIPSGLLLKAAFEVLEVTRADRKPDEFEQIIVDELRPYSTYLRERAA